jgi:hypothetical protein
METSMMRPLAASLFPLIAACTPQGTSSDVTRVVNTIPADSMRACATATAEEAGVPAALVTVTAARAEGTGPALTMNANGVAAMCKLNNEGEVTSVTIP